MTPPPAGRPLPMVAIVGRPNAGKSTLFNRLTRSQKAQVDAMPGVTRDRNFAEARHGDHRYLVVDTGGIDLEAESGIVAEIRSQSELAIEDADAIILLLDGREGVSPADREVVEMLRRSRKPFWVAVNKLDVPKRDDDAVDFYQLGLEEVLPISAAHGRGIGDLMDRVLDAVGEVSGGGEARPAGAIGVAIVGRPNVGKSSLVNRLLGYDRSIVTPVAGTTRDAIDTQLNRDGRDYVLIDTAGIRRRPKVDRQLERGSVVRALRSLERSDVAVVVIEAVEGMTDQDARLAGYAWERGRAMVLVVNKCDLIDQHRGFEARIEAEIRHQYPFLDTVPLLFTSAASGAGVGALLPMVDFVGVNHRRELPTVRLNQVFRRATEVTAPPSVKGKRPNFKYAVQTGICPPSIVFFCSHPDLVADSYGRFLLNRLREEFDLRGTPVRLSYRRSSGAPGERGGRAASGRSAAGAKTARTGAAVAAKKTAGPQRAAKPKKVARRKKAGGARKGAPSAGKRGRGRA
jgi:GTP-binding protein